MLRSTVHEESVAGASRLRAFARLSSAVVTLQTRYTTLRPRLPGRDASHASKRLLCPVRCAVHDPTGTRRGTAAGDGYRGPRRQDTSHRGMASAVGPPTPLARARGRCAQPPKQPASRRPAPQRGLIEADATWWRVVFQYISAVTSWRCASGSSPCPPSHQHGLRRSTARRGAAQPRGELLVGAQRGRPAVRGAAQTRTRTRKAAPRRAGRRGGGGHLQRLELTLAEGAVHHARAQAQPARP